MVQILNVDQIDNQAAKPFGYVYMSTNKVNGKSYIGQKSGKFNPKYLGSGKLIREDISKYGSENFEVILLEYAYSETELSQKEGYYIDKYDACNNEAFYNIKRVTVSPTLGRSVLDSTKLKIRNSNIGQVRSKETRQRMSKNHTDVSGTNNPFYGLHHSDESKRLMSIHTDVTGSKNPMYGKKHSLESKLKMSETQRKNQTGRIWVTDKSSVELRIKYEELEEFKSKGYVRGRLRRNQK